MLVKFAIEPDAFADSAQDSQDTVQIRENIAFHVGFIRWWESSACLVDPLDASRSDSISYVLGNMKLSRGVRDRWQLAIGRMSRRQVNRDDSGFLWSSLESHDDFEGLDKRIELALIDEDRAGYLTLEAEEEGLLRNNDDASVLCCNVDVVALTKYHLSKTYANVQEQLSGKVKKMESLTKENRKLRNRKVTHEIPRYMHLDDVWNEHFKELAHNVRGKIVIVDRYAIGEWRDSHEKGLVRLLGYLDMSSRGCDVEIYSGIAPVIDRETGKILETYDDVRKRCTKAIRSEVKQLSARGIKSVTLYLMHDAEFKRVTGDRHLRFDDTVCAGIHVMNLFQSWNFGLSSPETDKKHIYTQDKSKAARTLMEGRECQLKHMSDAVEKYVPSIWHNE